MSRWYCSICCYWVITGVDKLWSRTDAVSAADGCRVSFLGVPLCAVVCLSLTCHCVSTALCQSLTCRCVMHCAICWRAIVCCVVPVVDMPLCAVLCCLLTCRCVLFVNVPLCAVLQSWKTTRSMSLTGVLRSLMFSAVGCTLCGTARPVTVCWTQYCRRHGVSWTATTRCAGHLLTASVKLLSRTYSDVSLLCFILVLVLSYYASVLWCGCLGTGAASDV